MSHLSNNDRKILRFVLAITTGFTIAQLIDWQLSYIMPILLSMLMTGPSIDLKAGFSFFAVIVCGCLFGLFLSMTVVNYPFVCLLVFALALMHIYIAENKGLSPFVVIMLIMGVTVIPLIGLPSIQLSVLLVEALITSGFVAVLVALFFFSLIPTEKESPPEPKAQDTGAIALSAEKAGMISTLVIMPLITIFYCYSITNGIIILVFAAILAQTVDLATTAKGGAALVLANGIGGVFAVIIYNMLVIAPVAPMMILVIALFATVFAGKIFSGEPTAPLYSSAFTVVLLLVGSSVSSVSGDAGEAFVARLVQIFLAAAYVVVAFSLLKKLSGYLNSGTDKHEIVSETAIITDVGI